MSLLLKIILPICCLLTFPSLFAQSQTNPTGYLLDCGAGESSSAGVTVNGLRYVTDEGFTSAGNITKLKQNDLVPILSTLRYFPDTSARKFCYSIPVIKGGKYLVKTTYYYGGFDGGDKPPVFDQIVEGTKWGVVDTSEDYANGLSSFYEIVVLAKANRLSVCVARNGETKSSPFMSALEVENLDDSLYNATDFANNALSTVARYDKFNRIWQPFKDLNPVVISHHKVNPLEFWNVPPEKAFKNAITTSRGKRLQIQWPQISVSTGDYYIALYFQDNRTPSPYSWRVFDVLINGNKFYANLNVTTKGVTVYSTQWPLSGQTEIVLIPSNDMPVGPVINAAEVLQILPLGGKTLSKDVVAMLDLGRQFNNPPSDWSGDPCLPKENSWTGVTSNLTALNHIWLGGNKLSGTIPEMWSLKDLRSLHLENNQFEGPVPKSLSQLPHLSEIFLNNNKLDGQNSVTAQ
ncbi:hypothetical protein F8388_007932 [Cannabis sativa]|uniref:Malectin-like domain-containing protein n=1 Tax=Cannabis sativa TaxID=3483 RepID=A0A7J6FTH9_CANSA|nr:hypothetical protein F8388_007932 [Cannabis sativa]